jgi:nitrogen fixation/metabolism regulation signal transduction histidine kinase
MLHSGRILSLNVKEDKLARVFSTIDERIKHLSEFVQGYGEFAKIPEPKLQRVSSKFLLDSLSQQWFFNYDQQQDCALYADPTQLEQLLINLLKNAHESGSPAEHIAIQIKVNKARRESEILVTDAGKGVASGSLNSVLIPFYSTKSNGTGLGLALCREIVEAHHGNIALSNREQGGLMVKVTLPLLAL